MLSKSTIKIICDLYHDGHPVSEIAGAIHHGRDAVYRNLRKYYRSVIGEDFLLNKEIKQIKLSKLKDEFEKIYVPFKYSRASLSRALGCSAVELECMLQKYNLTHLRLQTYKSQRTLCNVPKEIYEEYQEFANANDMSMRDLACRAINEYILWRK